MNRLQRTRRILQRTLLHALPTTLGIVIVVFFLLQLVPGDAADVLAAEAGSATAETMTMLRAQFGLDQPILSQLLSYLGNLSHFSLGFSPRYNAPVMDLIMSRLPSTLLLMLLSQTIAIVLGIALGAVMAVWAGKWPDRLLSLLALLLYSTPGFWIGLMTLILFSVQLDWLPSGGNITIGADLTGWAYVADMLRHAILPVLALSSFFIAIYARLTRAAMLEIAQQDFVRTAHAKGLAPWFVTVRHILRCALLPITTVAGMHFGNLLGGAAVVETVFSWPGLGRLALEAVMARDFNVLLGVLLLSALLVIVANILVDLLQSWLDPRIKAH
ncbi:MULTISPECIES: ABC transporter permease [unclassified Symbiopectobacterium]|uniref:ABC transporter permease n=1 Tax=unclassified Symbiopectobacterium TaxID=2794573 RepID=UPI002227E973|nr:MULTISPECIES: ABC transporter permease [unclassified Symbiopectobacterium]MCW2474926.1 ABC transporter permease [Candidatus Symbiopectobacterium sp. NZEC151]MCW2487346.1 ABC transporter permease [Candidatus Symbiopectobacterium sp. NZEC127]